MPPETKTFHLTTEILNPDPGSTLFHAGPIAPISPSVPPNVPPDGDTQSYWASTQDPASRVDVQLDFGTAKQIKVVEIDWELPAQVRQIICWRVFGAPRFVCVRV